MALPNGFLEELRARIPLAALVGRRVKLERAGRQWRGCCPFHGEKTPSFYVYDDHYHCFGCGAHGDAIGFVMQGGSGFLEAVSQLAAEAGLEVPKASPDAERMERRRLDLHEVLDAAAAHFRRALREPGGRAGLDYLRGRGLSDDTIAGFGLGWAGAERGALASALGRRGIDPALLTEAGLLRREEDGPARDFFFNRVVFPIRDRRGRAVSFGARTLGDAQPKYLNGPETAVFSKRRTLFGLDRAWAHLHAPAAKGAEPPMLLAVEGYMDVIALHQAGFAGAVAPLGTALGAEQLEQLWRLSPVPILCFDGDGAGRRAALRAMEQSLPLLTAERGLRVVTLPEGQDPDSLLRTGAGAFRAEAARARPLSEALHAALAEGLDLATPEGRARHRNRLAEAAERIGDKVLGREYRQQWLFARGPRRTGPGRTGPGQGGPNRGGSAPQPARTRPDPDGVALRRLDLLAAIALHHPHLLPEIHDAWCRLDLPGAMDALRQAMLDWSEGANPLDSARLFDHLRSGAGGAWPEAERILASSVRVLPACGRPDAPPAEARRGWWHFFELARPNGLALEIEETRRLFDTRPDEASRRLIALCTIREAMHRGEHGLDEEQ